MTMTDSPDATVSNGRTTRARSTPGPDDSIALLSTGKVRAVIGGVTHTLRRPTLGELRLVREAWIELAEEQRQRIEAYEEKEREAAIDGSGGIPARTFDADDDLFIGWFRDVFAMLSNASLPEADDDMPPWFVRGDLPGDLMTHWRSVPLVPGDR